MDNQKSNEAKGTNVGSTPGNQGSASVSFVVVPPITVVGELGPRNTDGDGSIDALDADRPSARDSRRLVSPRRVAERRAREEVPMFGDAMYEEEEFSPRRDPERRKMLRRRLEELT